MTDNCAGGVTCTLNEKENARVPGARLQRRSLPASKSQSPQVPKQVPLSRLALARRPLIDTKNLMKESSRQAPQAALISVEGSRKCGQDYVKKSAVTSTMVVSATRQTGWPIGQAFRGGVSQPNLSLAENEEGEVNCEEERFPWGSASSVMESQQLPFGVQTETAPLYEGQPASDIMNRTWSKPEGPFFPSLQEESKEEEDSQNGVTHQGGESISPSPGSLHSSLRHQHLGAKHRKCLTPIFEMSLLKEGEAVEAADGDTERIAVLYQHFFAEECAIVIDNIRRTSCQEVLGHGSSVKSSMDTFDIPNIKEESFPPWNYLNSSLEGSAVPLEMDVSKSGVSFLPVSLDGKRGTDKSEENQVGKIPESRVCNVTFSLKDDLSVLMGKTQFLHRSEVSDSLLENTYSLEGDLGKDVLEGHTQNLTVESERGLNAKVHSKEDISADVNSNGTYVIYNDSPDAGPNVTIDVKEQSMRDSEARALTKTSSSNCNDMYELQPTEERGCERVAHSEERDTVKLDPNSPQRALAAESLCDNCMNGAENGLLSLENTLDLKDNFLVTSTPVPAPKLLNLTKEIDCVTSEVCKRLMVADSVNVCLQDTVDGADGGRPLFHAAALPVDGADGGGSSLHTSGLPLMDIKAAVRSPPNSAAPAPKQDTAYSRLSLPLWRRSLLPPSSALRNSKALQPLAQPASSHRLSLPATAKSQAAHKVPGADALGSSGKKPEGASRSLPKQPKANVEASSVLESRKEKTTVAEGKLHAARLQRPRASGIPSTPASCTSRLSLRPPGHAEASESEGRRIPPPVAGQKQLRGGAEESLPMSKRKRVADVPPCDVPKGRARPASVTSRLQRPTTALKDLEAKPNADTSSHSSSRTLKESSKQAVVTQGLRMPTARARALGLKPDGAARSLERRPSQVGQLVPSVTDSPASATGAEHCQDCVRYREEINRLRSALHALTGIVE